MLLNGREKFVLVSMSYFAFYIMVLYFTTFGREENAERSLMDHICEINRRKKNYGYKNFLY